MTRQNIQVAAAIVLFYVIIESLGVTCPIRFLTGVSCAGCGMSRAWLSLVRLDVAGAFSFHPLFWLPVPAAVVLLLKKKLSDKLYYSLIVTIGVLFLAVYVFRLLSPEDAIVVWEPAHGLIGQFLSRALGKIG